MQKRISVSIIILFLLFTCAAAFSSCKSDPDKGRIPYSPRSGIYEVMLDPESQWALMDNAAQSINAIALYNSTVASGGMTLMVQIDCYSKSDLSILNVSDIDSFIKFYKTFDYVKGIYESDKNTVADLSVIGTKEMKNTPLKAGKRQEIYIKNTNGETETDSTSEFIYLETQNYYFAVSYGMLNENLTENVKTAVNDLIFHIRESQNSTETSAT